MAGGYDYIQYIVCLHVLHSFASGGKANMHGWWFIGIHVPVGLVVRHIYISIPVWLLVWWICMAGDKVYVYSISA